LAYTGSNILPLLVLAVGLIAAGSLAVVMGRRRRRHG
jgi:LPXTG-motif cell wall-anchored protein